MRRSTKDSRSIREAMLIADAEIDAARREPLPGQADSSPQGDLVRGRELVRALRWRDTRLADVDLVDRVQRVIASRPARQSSRAFRRPLLGIAAMVTLAVGGAWWMVQDGGVSSTHAVGGRSGGVTSVDGVRRKGTANFDRDKWVGLQVYHLEAGGDPRLIGASVERDDELLFAYTNLGPQPFPYLMVFAIDAAGAVHWSYPAWQRRGTDPSSIRIAQGRAGVELGELVQHDLAPGPMTICGLFLREPLKVSQIEAAIRNASQRGPLMRTLSTIRPADSGLHLIRVEVLR